MRHRQRNRGSASPRKQILAWSRPGHLNPPKTWNQSPKYRMKSKIHQYHLKVIQRQIPQRGESSQAPSAAPPVAAAQDANVLMFGLLKQMMDLVGILTTQLKPNEAAASGSTGVKVVKRLPIKIPLPKAFEGDRDYERVATWLREVENFFRAMA